jgi:hypothetical protein
MITTRRNGRGKANMATRKVRRDIYLIELHPFCVDHTAHLLAKKCSQPGERFVSSSTLGNDGDKARQCGEKLRQACIAFHIEVRWAGTREKPRVRR